MHEYQLFSIPVLESDHNQHLFEVLDVGGQKALVILLGGFQELHSILEHQMVQHEPLVQSQLDLLPCEGFKEIECLLFLRHPPFPHVLFQ